MISYLTGRVNISGDFNMKNRELFIKQKKLLDTFLDVPLEIERKYLIEYPDVKWLEGLNEVCIVDITQHYFDSKTEKKLRIRCWQEKEKTKYILTKKTRVNDLVRFEEENEISREEYELLLKRAAANAEYSNLRKICKKRYRFPYAGKVVEVDIFPFWTDKALAEVELECEEETVELPPELKVIREVTEEKEFTNYNLAEKCV